MPFPNPTVAFLPSFTTRRTKRRTRIVTMPVELGFTSHLVETLHSCRTKLDAYAVRKKAAMDADVQALEQERQKNQDLIGNHVRNLQAVQSERGFASEEGIAQRRRDLNSQQRQLQERIQELTKEQEEQEQIAQGN
jgi:tRNA uridine 5-carbamoylmethylation protein Kti12